MRLVKLKIYLNVFRLSVKALWIGLLNGHLKASFALLKWQWHMYFAFRKTCAQSYSLIATGHNIDRIAEMYGTQRLSNESDDELKKRILSNIKKI